MISTWLTEKKIQIVDSVSDWRQAVTISAEPLLADESINEHYIEAIFGRDANLVVMVDCQIPADDLVVHFL